MELQDALQWISANKDALIAIAAIASPFVALFGNIRLMEVQREIASANNDAQNRQIDIQRKTLNINLIGNHEHKWMDEFRNLLSETCSVLRERARLVDRKKSVSLDQQEQEELTKLTHQSHVLINSMELLISIHFEEYADILVRLSDVYLANDYGIALINIGIALQCGRNILNKHLKRILNYSA